MPWWEAIEGSALAQGDMLPDCLLPIFANPTPSVDGEPRDIEVEKQRLIVVTQSCDLENNKVKFVALCPIHTLSEFAAVNTQFSNMKNWEPVRKGNRPALHMLASHDPTRIEDTFVVDFGHIVSLPIAYLSRHAGSIGSRWRLASPYLEHFSQAFARFFMRVGLPSAIAPFK